MDVRVMQSSDLNFAAESALSVGWTSETRDLFEGFFLHDPDGCFIAEISGNPIGICIATSYGEYGFVGELIVREAYRGRSIGPRLLDHAIAYLRKKKVRHIYLDGVVAAVPYYQSIGFRKICPSLRFVGKPDSCYHSNVRPMQQNDLNSVYKLDNKYFDADRSFFLKHRFSLFPKYCQVYEKDGSILGFIMAIAGKDVVSVGPMIVHESVQRPLDLLENLALETGETCLRIGVLEKNNRAVQVMVSVKSMKKFAPSWRMVLGTSEKLGASEQCFAIGSAAKG